MMKKLWSNEKGFTLMEIVIVIVILGILALLAIPRLLGFTEQAEIANDKEYAAVVGKAAELYWASHDRQITTGSTVGVDDTVYNVLVGAELFNNKENSLQYFEPGHTVTVYISTGVTTVAANEVADSENVDNNASTTSLEVDEGVAIVTITDGAASNPKSIIYTSQYGYTTLP